MRLWARAHWVWAYAAVTIAAALTLRMYPRLTFAFPNIRTGELIHVPLGYAAALLPAVLWIALIDFTSFELEAVSVRRRRLLTLETAAAWGAPAVAAAVLCVAGGPVGFATTRDLVLFQGLAVVALAVTRRRVVFLIPTAAFLVCAAAGFAYAAPRPDAWAIPLDRWVPERDLWVIAAAIVVSAAVLIGRRLRW